MFFDWLSCYQDYDFDLPFVSETGFVVVDLKTMEFGQVRQARIHHEGSYSTKITINVNGRRIYIAGNPSRYGRIDNLHGYPTIEQCIGVYNEILAKLGLPSFTKGKFVGYDETEGDTPELRARYDGLVITEVHITDNAAVGQGCEVDYFKAVSMLPYRYSVPRLHANGRTVDWLSKQGNATELYAKVYDKANELRLHHLGKIKRKFGEQSEEYGYLLTLIDYLESVGGIRYEQKLRGGFLQKNGLKYWAVWDSEKLVELSQNLFCLDNRLKVTSMKFEMISEKLMSEGICKSVKSANATAAYVYQWMHGSQFDENKSQVRLVRRRLRKIGIDILQPCNLTTFSPVIVKSVKEIVKQPLVLPDWYRYPQQHHLKLVA